MMLPTRVRVPLDRSPLAREAVIVALLFGGFLLWIELLQPVANAVESVTGPLVGSEAWPLVDDALVTGSIIVAGAVVFTAVYTRARNLPLSLDFPEQSDQQLLAAVTLAPTVGVVSVYGLAHATGTTLSALSGTYVAADATLTLPVIVMVIGLFVGLPTYVLLAHALVQRTFRIASGPWVAIGLTTVLVGSAGPTDLIGVVSGVRVAVVSLLLAVAIALPAYAIHSFDRAWLPWVCALPLALFVAGFITEWLMGLDGPATGAYALAEVAVVALGGYAYERTESFLAPALTYTSFVVSSNAIILLFETGIRP